MLKFDYKLKVNKPNPVVLQLTDTQIIDSSQRRYPQRLSPEEIDKWNPDNLNIRLLRYIESCIKKTNPDLIVISGDFCYGEFDDSGKNFLYLVNYLDSYKIPWTMVYGNHDRDADFGVVAMNEALEKSTYCLFKGENSVNGKVLEGNGNFSIALYNNNSLKCSLYLLDSGAGTEKNPCGIYKNQREWLTESVKYARSINNAPSFVFMHIPPLAFYSLAKRHGYDEEHTAPVTLEPPIGFGKWSEKSNINYFHDGDGSLFELIKSLSISGIDVGHFHKNSACAKYENVLLTYGLKTGEYDAYLTDSLGGTITAIDERYPEGYIKKHIYVNFGGEVCK